MSGSTSQPNLKLDRRRAPAHPARHALDSFALNEFSDYWEKGAGVLRAVDVAPKTGSAEVYFHEMPGGQYTTCGAGGQHGVARRWPEIARLTPRSNLLFGDIGQGHPPRSVGGRYGLVPAPAAASGRGRGEPRARGHAFPESVIDMLDGGLGWPPGGWPEPVWRVVLGDERSFEGAEALPGRRGPRGDAAEGVGQPGRTLRSCGPSFPRSSSTRRATTTSIPI